MALGQSREKSGHLAETVHEAKRLSQEVRAVRAQVDHLRVVTRAMWNLIKSEVGSNDEKLRQSVKVLKESAESEKRVAEQCSQCSRPLQGNSVACIYCGAKVEKQPLF